MRRKSEKGHTPVEAIVVVVVILIIVAIAAPKLSYLLQQPKNFKESFGVEMGEQWPSEKIQIIQPLVTKRLQELKNNLQLAREEKAKLLSLPETTTPEEVTQRMNKLKEIEAKIASASNALDKAENSAEYFRFKFIF